MHMKKMRALSKEQLISEMWRNVPDIKDLLVSSDTLKEARTSLFDHIHFLEKSLFKAQCKPFNNIYPVEKKNVKECMRVLKNIIRKENEHLTGFSAMECLWNLAKKPDKAKEDVKKGFVAEMFFLLKGICGKSEMFINSYKGIETGDSRRIALERSKILDEYSAIIDNGIVRYTIGLEEKVMHKREKFKRELLSFFGIDEKKWKNYKWHLAHIIQDVKTIEQLIRLEEDEKEGLEYAQKNNIAFQITPYYLSLFNPAGRTEEDRAIRAQVLPSLRYCKSIVSNRKKGQDMDFMGEKATSVMDCITRRYPQIVIIKPFDSCPQICVYCQRNWEIKALDDAKITRRKTQKALEWIKNNKHIKEVLVTGGDPLVLDNNHLLWLIGYISEIPHIERIRIGTRAIVTLPCRIDSGFIRMLKKYHSWGKREVCVVTHIEHSSEVTPDVLRAVRKIKNAGMNVYNQQVFTYYNSRRFETAALRRALKIAGIDPYYNFNTKGKEETADFRVPMARIEQERQEEARLLPGMVRMDEPIFNVPKIGKSYLRAWQDHEVIMVLSDGRRVYRFYPWESQLLVRQPYLYTDVSIYDYLARLDEEKEDTEEYKSIWYYF